MTHRLRFSSGASVLSSHQHPIVCRFEGLRPEQLYRYELHRRVEQQCEWQIRGFRTAAKVTQTNVRRGPRLSSFILAA
ncbi:hypothetical protein GCM10011326_48530 [Salipiger profundus]|nr:hypothetical protein GCM10011326_48530 [Salipiger profundus]